MSQLRPIDWVPVGCFGLLPLVATFVHKGAVIVLGIVGIAALCTAVSQQTVRDVFSRKLVLFSGIGVAWLIVASLISPDVKGGILKILQVCALAALFYLSAWLLRGIPIAVRKLVIQVLSIGTLIALVTLVFGYLVIDVFDLQLIHFERGNSLSVLYPGLIVVGLLLPGVFGYLRQSGKTALMWATACVALALSFAIGSVIATLLIVFTIVSSVIFRRNSAYLPRLLALILVVVTITLPLSMPLVLDRVAVMFVEDHPQSANAEDTELVIGTVAHRYRIWRFAADRAAERPFFGWGFNASRSLPGGHGQVADGAELLPLHPHNAVLQVWLELGMPGLILLCVLLWRTFMPPRWQDFKRREMLIRTQTVTVIFLAASASFGIWQSWWLAVLALVMASTSLWHEGEAEL